MASAVRDVLDANGSVVQVDLWHTNPPGQVYLSGPYPPIPEVAIDELRRRWLGPDRRAGRGFRNTSPDREDAVFQAAGFAPEELVVVPTTGSLSVRSRTWWRGFSLPHQRHLTSSGTASTSSSGSFDTSCSMRLPKVASAWRYQTTDFAFAAAVINRVP